MATIIMYWDEEDVFGNVKAGIRIENSPSDIVIPSNACGFRLGHLNEDWHEAWHFSPLGNPGKELLHFGIQYSSEFTGTPSPSAIEARGPVHGCAGSNGAFEFVTPLGSYGIVGDAPQVNGAGSFSADFVTEDDIEWLDSAGSLIETEEPGPDFEPASLPPEFFEEPPVVKGCFRDFEGDLHCPEDADTTGKAATEQSPFPKGGLAIHIAKNSHLLPKVEIAEEATGTKNTVSSGNKVEVHCPAELHLTATFFKAAGVEPATILYRFRFAHGPISTVFSTFVDNDGANPVFHSVPIPLPKPIGPTPQGGVTAGASHIAVFEPPVDPVGPIPTPISDFDNFEVQALPDNEHKSSVRVEVLNAHDGIVASASATYHLVCAVSSGRPRLTPGLLGPRVISLQSVVNRWLIENQMDALRIDGKFGPRTETAVRAFQKDQSLDADGIVGPRTWKKLLSFPESDENGNHH